MSIHVNITHEGRRKEIFDDVNPRNCSEEWRCEVCAHWVDHETIVWSEPDGTLTTMSEDARPYCLECLPNETPEPT